MKNLLRKLGLMKEEKEMTLDEYIISIRPKTRELSHLYTTVLPSAKVEEEEEDDSQDGPEEAGCMVPA